MFVKHQPCNMDCPRHLGQTPEQQQKKSPNYHWEMHISGSSL